MRRAYRVVVAAYAIASAIYSAQWLVRALVATFAVHTSSDPAGAVILVFVMAPIAIGAFGFACATALFSTALWKKHQQVCCAICIYFCCLQSSIAALILSMRASYELGEYGNPLVVVWWGAVIVVSVAVAVASIVALVRHKTPPAPTPAPPDCKQ